MRGSSAINPIAQVLPELENQHSLRAQFEA